MNFFIITTSLQNLLNQILWHFRFFIKWPGVIMVFN